MIFKNLKHRFKLAKSNFHLIRKYDVLIEKGVTSKYEGSLSFGNKCTVQSGTYLYGSRNHHPVVIGDNVVLSMNNTILGEGGVAIGSGSHLGPNVTVLTQYAHRESSEKEGELVLRYKAVSIGRDCWLGAGTILMPGTVLGDNCTTAPNSVVYGKWGDEVVLEGNPARPR